MDEVTGEYRLMDMTEPSIWYVTPFSLLAVTVHNGSLELGSPFIDGSVTLRPLGSGRYRVGGISFGGATVLIEDDHLYLHMLEAQRVSPFLGSTALIIYGAVFVLLILSLIVFGIFRLIRRLRN